MLNKMTDRECLQRELDERFKSLSSNDPLAEMTLLREFKDECYAHIADTSKRESISLALNALSEIILSKVYDLSLDFILQSFELIDAKEEIKERVPFAILAYGNLGAKELNYASDLDLVFLHDTQHDHIPISLNRHVSACEFTTRLAQRIIYVLSTSKISGVLFQVDVRLRPDGHAGLLVSQFSAFSKYLHVNAWNWEHAALVKARMVIGTSAFSQKFEALRREVLEGDHDLNKNRDEIIAMRKKISQKKRNITHIHDLKSMEGGVGDIDFVVQYVILRYIRIYPDLINERSSLKILPKLKEYQLLDKIEVQTLMSAYAYYKSLARKPSCQLSNEACMRRIKTYSEKVKAIWLKRVANKETN